MNPYSRRRRSALLRDNLHHLAGREGGGFANAVEDQEAGQAVVVEGHARGAVRAPGQSWRGPMVEKFYLLPFPRVGGRACAGSTADGLSVARGRQMHDGHIPSYIQVAYIDTCNSPTAEHAPTMCWTRLFT